MVLDFFLITIIIKKMEHIKEDLVSLCNDVVLYVWRVVWGEGLLPHWWWHYARGVSNRVMTILYTAFWRWFCVFYWRTFYVLLPIVDRGVIWLSHGKDIHYSDAICYLMAARNGWVNKNLSFISVVCQLNGLSDDATHVIRRWTARTDCYVGCSITRNICTLF